MADKVMVYVAMACMIMADSDGICSYGALVIALYSYGLYGRGPASYGLFTGGLI